MTHNPKYDMQILEHYDIELCAMGENLYSAFHRLWTVDATCNLEYKAYLEHRRKCPECKEFIKQ